METPDKTALKDSMEQARRQLGPAPEPAPHSGLASQVVHQVTEGARAHPGLWIGGAALVGFALGSLFRSRKAPPVVEVAAAGAGSSLLMGALAKGFALAQPHLVELGKRKLSEFLQKSQGTAQGAPAAGGSVPQKSVS